MRNVLFYNKDSGAAAVGRVDDNKFHSTQEFGNGSFSTGWTNIADGADLVFYNRQSGSYGTGSLNQGKFVSGKAFGPESLAPGWDLVARMVENTLFYKDDGSAVILKTNPFTPPFSVIKSFAAGAFAPHWTHIVWSQGVGLFYSAENGAA